MSITTSHEHGDDLELVIELVRDLSPRDDALIMGGPRTTSALPPVTGAQAIER